MCGILGYSGSAPADPAKIRSLFHASKSRGNSSAGMIGYNDKENKAYVLKLASKYYKAVEDITLSESFNDLAASNELIAHTRMPTRGANTKENTHPFLVEGYYLDQVYVKTENGESVPKHNVFNSNHFKMYGVHNGVCSNTGKLMSSIEEDDDMSKTDSEMMFKFIAARKLKGKSVSEINASMALAMMVKHSAPSDKKAYWDLVLYRESNPCFLGLSETKDGFYFSSIKDALEDIGCTNIKSLDRHVFHTFKRGNLIKLTNSIPF